MSKTQSPGGDCIQSGGSSLDAAPKRNAHPRETPQRERCILLRIGPTGGSSRPRGQKNRTSQSEVRFLGAASCCLVEVTGLEPAASWSQTTRATNCATPRYSSPLRGAFILYWKRGPASTVSRHSRYIFAKPPSLVSRYLENKSRPVSYMVFTTMSKEIFRV